MIRDANPIRAGNKPAEATYISCSRHELVELEIEAWRQGLEQARAEGVMVIREINRIAEVAEEAYQRALEVYVPLDAAKFREVFTLAWTAGYYTHAKTAL